MNEWEPKEYDAWYDTPLGRTSDWFEKELIFSLTGAKNWGRVLDVGCGTGAYSIELAKRGALTTGVDGSERMLGWAAAKAAKERLYVNFVRADALMLPFPDGHFDFVLSVGALCFAKDEDKALLEMRRVLKPGGRLVVGVLNKWSPWALLRRIKGLFKKTIYQKARFISPPELESSLKRAGFEVKTLQTSLFFLPINSGAYLWAAAPFEKALGMVAPRMGAFIAASAIKP